MAVFPGPLGSDPQRTAAPFMPREIFDPVLVWAVLDCPGGWTLNLPFRPTVLGRMTAQILDVPAIGEQCVVVGMLDHREGRKAYTRTTAYGADGRTLGQAAATWIEIAR
jgi:hypothetical protein